MKKLSILISLLILFNFQLIGQEHLVHNQEVPFEQINIKKFSGNSSNLIISEQVLNMKPETRSFIINQSFQNIEQKDGFNIDEYTSGFTKQFNELKESHRSEEFRNVMVGHGVDLGVGYLLAISGAFPKTKIITKILGPIVKKGTSEAIKYVIEREMKENIAEQESVVQNISSMLSFYGTNPNELANANDLAQFLFSKDIYKDNPRIQAHLNQVGFQTLFEAVKNNKDENDLNHQHVQRQIGVLGGEVMDLQGNVLRLEGQTGINAIAITNLSTDIDKMFVSVNKKMDAWTAEYADKYGQLAEAQLKTFEILDNFENRITDNTVRIVKLEDEFENLSVTVEEHSKLLNEHSTLIAENAMIQQTMSGYIFGGLDTGTKLNALGKGDFDHVFGDMSIPGNALKKQKMIDDLEALKNKQDIVDVLNTVGSVAGGLSDINTAVNKLGWSGDETAQDVAMGLMTLEAGTNIAGFIVTGNYFGAAVAAFSFAGNVFGKKKDSGPSPEMQYMQFMYKALSGQMTQQHEEVYWHVRVNGSKNGLPNRYGEKDV